MEPIKWIDRKFEFNQPASLFPMTLERLRGTPLRLRHYTELLPKKILTLKTNNSWSIQEHAGHLVDLEELHDGRIDDFLEGKTMLRAADMQNKKTYTANHNTANIKDILSAFEKVRANYIARLEALDDKTLVKTAIHPRLNAPVRPVDMALFTAEHDDQHLAAMHKLIMADKRG